MCKTRAIQWARLSCERETTRCRWTWKTSVSQGNKPAPLINARLGRKTTLQKQTASKSGCTSVGRPSFIRLSFPKCCFFPKMSVCTHVSQKVTLLRGEPLKEDGCCGAPKRASKECYTSVGKEVTTGSKLCSKMGKHTRNNKTRKH